MIFKIIFLIYLFLFTFINDKCVFPFFESEALLLFTKDILVGPFSFSVYIPHLSSTPNPLKQTNKFLDSAPECWSPTWNFFVYGFSEPGILGWTLHLGDVDLIVYHVTSIKNSLA